MASFVDKTDAVFTTEIFSALPSCFEAKSILTPWERMELNGNVREKVATSQKRTLKTDLCYLIFCGNMLVVHLGLFCYIYLLENFLRVVE